MEPAAATPTPARDRRLALLVSGASGMLLAQRALRALTAHPAVERLHLVVSRGASQVLRHELASGGSGAADLLGAAELGAAEAARLTIHRDNELGAVLASGSYRLAGTLVLPCSGGTLGALATGAASSLVHRAGAVALKEGWPLVLGFRETPLNLVHLENLRRLAYAGAVVLPPIPAFYLGGEDLDRFVDAYLLRVMDHLGLGSGADRASLRWQGAGARRSG